MQAKLSLLLAGFGPGQTAENISRWPGTFETNLRAALAARSLLGAGRAPYAVRG